MNGSFGAQVLPQHYIVLVDKIFCFAFLLPNFFGQTNPKKKVCGNLKLVGND